MAIGTTSGPGVYQLVNPPVSPGVVLFHLHANVWWGAALLLFGLNLLFQVRAES
jgi:hypothetical protein